MERFKLLKKTKINELPKTSGVYCFAEKKADFRCPPIYIGKAINIQNRVKNHFQQPSYRDNLFITKVGKIGYLETNSEIEALVLEANLIKKYQPKYNVVWRDDKNYFYVAIAKNEQGLPYIYITHQKTGQKTQYIGPFVEGTALKKTLKYLRRVFPYYTSKKHPKIKCAWCHLDLCPGPRLFEARLDSPEGEAAALVKEYKKNIKKLVLILQGKRGAVLRALKKEMAQLSKENKFEEAAKTRDRLHALESIMAHVHVISNEERGFLPRGKKPRSSAFEELQKIIGIKNSINKIECYDVSNIQGKQATGSMVVFINGAPDKSQYKKFKIRLNDEPNDIAMLKETLERRFLHPEWPYPEVILIDGGKAQLNVAIRAKDNKDIKIISIAKGKQELWIGNKTEPIPLKDLPQEVYNLIKHLDDEAHRFAISYHKKLRKKDLFR